MRRAWLLVVIAVGGCASGKVVGSVRIDGANLPRPTVTLSGPVSESTSADSAGAYSFGALPDGTYTVSVSAPSTAEGQAQATAVVHSGKTTTVAELVLTAVGSITGKATLGGAATGNGGIVVFVSDAGQAAYTDDAGNYVIPNVPVGARSISAAKVGYTTATTGAVNVVYAQSATAAALELAIGQTGVASIRGVVTLLGKSDFSGTTVTLSGTPFTTVTAAGGEFRFDGVPAGSYALAFTNGGSVDTIPTVEALPGTYGLVPAGDGVLHALGPIELQPQPRLASGATAPLLSPDGRSVAFVAPDGSLQIAGLHGGRRVTLTGPPGPAGNLVDIKYQFTPDGATIVALPPDGVLSSVPASGGPVTTLGKNVSDFTLSPDGSLVAFITERLSNNGKLSVTPIGGGLVTFLAPDSSMNPRFSPDGRLIYYWDSQDNVQVMKTSGGAPTLLRSGVFPPAQINQTNFGTVTSISGGTLTLVNLNAGTVVRDLVSDIYNYTGTNLTTPDGHSLVYQAGTLANGDQPIKLIKAFDSTPSTVTLSAAGEIAYIYGATFSANGANYFYTSRPTLGNSNVSNLEVAAVSTPGAPRLLNATGAYVTALAATPDLTRIVWVETLGQQARLMTASTNDAYDKIVPKQLAAMPGAADPTVWTTSVSPDGANVLLSAPGGALTVYPLAGGQGTLLAIVRDTYFEPHFSPDGKHVISAIATSELAGGFRQYTMYSSPTSGGVASPLLGLFASASLWASDGTLILQRSRTPQPYAFQDGLYEATLP